MEHYFELPVTHNGETLNLKGRLLTFAYNYKFHIIVDGKELCFEKDEEGSVRVISQEKDNTIDPQVIKNIVSKLTTFSKG
ncbi:MAG TPA: hypothetical protein PKE30_11095 [Niabella sp.]|nr:hypothetical protein [Niabella sp.]